MRLDTKSMRYLSNEDWRVLTAVETGSRNHEVVPTPLIIQLSGLRGAGGVHKSISTLAKINLIARVKNAAYDGYRLTYGGLDYLALHTLQKQNVIYSVGNQIGVGKESDIFVVANQRGEQMILKIHRLGRISFRTVKKNRDYLRNRKSASWMYMSRLAALKEYAYMQALQQAEFPVPQPIAQNRHVVLMELIDAFPLRQISSVPDPSSLYAELMEMIVHLAGVGLIHGDFNEFNILIQEKEGHDQNAASIQKDAGITEPPLTSKSSSDSFSNTTLPANTPSSPRTITTIPILIDFPQMLSIDHLNASMYFARDVDCVKSFFARRFHFTSDENGPFFEEAKQGLVKDPARRLDVAVEASGFSRKMAKELEGYMVSVGVDGDQGTGHRDGEDGEDDEDDSEESDGEEDGEGECAVAGEGLDGNSTQLENSQGMGSATAEGDEA